MPLGLVAPSLNMKYGALIEQDGTIFIDNTARFPRVDNGTGWVPLSLAGMTPGFFTEVVDGVWFSSAGPDFSSTGSKMKFGFVVSNSTMGNPAENIGGVDNWRVQIQNTAIPEPSSFAFLGLLSAAFVGVSRWNAWIRPSAYLWRFRPGEGDE